MLNVAGVVGSLSLFDEHPAANDRVPQSKAILTSLIIFIIAIVFIRLLFFQSVVMVFVYNEAFVTIYINPEIVNFILRLRKDSIKFHGIRMKRAMRPIADRLAIPILTQSKRNPFCILTFLQYYCHGGVKCPPGRANTSRQPGEHCKDIV